MLDPERGAGPAMGSNAGSLTVVSVPAYCGLLLGAGLAWLAFHRARHRQATPAA